MNMDYNNEENLDVVDNTTQNVAQNSSSNFKTSKKTTDLVKKKMQEKISKSSVKNVAKKTLLKALMPIITWIAIFVIAIIIIIGIAMFFVTMPGMAIEKIKEFANVVGDAVASWFGEDETKQIPNDKIYDTLEYLEKMGYDIKGYGFLTGYVGDSEDGVERNDNDEIIDAESDFITSYLVSDKYIYTIKNFNMTSEKDWVEAALQHLASLFTKGQSNQYWSRGMLEFWLDGGRLGREEEFYNVYNMGTIEIDPEKQTLEIKRGWFNNSMTYNLEGWTGRYGMPVDFLLSVHVATMMPDLAYDMATTFETIIKILLHPVDGEENSAIGYYEVRPNEYISYEEFYELADSGIPFDEWRISKKEAKKIMEAFGIESPENCVGTADVGVDNIEPDSDGMQDETVDLKDDESNYQELVDIYNNIITKLKSEYNVTDALLQDAGLPITIASLEEFKDLLEDEENLENTPSTEYTYYEPSKGLSCVIIATVNSSEYESYNIELNLYYNNYQEIRETHDYPSGTYNTNINKYHNAGIRYKITGNWTQERIDEWLEENDIEVPEEARCSNSENEEVCVVCRNYIQKIYDYIKKVDDSDLKIYQPYISKVEKHWYRDVYFVLDTNKRTEKNIEFIDYDYDYEAVMKERWTLYETYEEDDGKEGLIGEYKLYTTDGELYDGTAQQAATEGIKVTKKAVTSKIENTYTDLNWNEYDGIYSAYEESGDTSREFQPVYPKIEENDPDAGIKSKIYVEIITTGNIVQTGEGLRTETNETIKKMFLENTYFRYDGTAKTAEIINELRNSNNLNYGRLEERDLEKTAKLDGETYKVSDYAGQVSLNQDSLNAFSMLENEHTLDADYIYRDFKELIVELGYFEKEELTDETPRIMQWLIPQVDSTNYPAREIDKNEHEYGTMIHSKGDISANKKNTLVAAIEGAVENEQSDENIHENLEQQNEEPKDIDDIRTLDKNVDDTVEGIENIENSNKFDLVGSASPTNTSGSLLSLDGWWEETQKMFDIYQSEGWVYSDHGDGISDGCNAGTTFETHGHNDTDCSIGASWMLQKLGALQDNHTFTSHMGHGGTLNESHVCAQDLLDAGAEVITPNDGTKFTNAANNGELEPGDVLFYNGHVSIYCGDSYDTGGTTFCWDTGSTSGIQKGGPRDTSYESRDIELIVRLPLGNSTSKNSDSYQGYNGNEAVVSPVTGVLLEYGTYTDNDVDSVSGEKYRTNVDLKYGTGTTNKQDDSTGEIQADKVGYAKILVLDEENYEILENALINSTRWSDKFLNENGNFSDIKNLTDEEINNEDKPWNDLERTLYGYKEFAELYQKYGISGNIIYIDGFKCELPQEDFNINEDIDKKVPDGEDINIEYFDKIQLSSFSNGDISDTFELLDSLYEKEEEYKMASKSATEKLNAESMIKDEAVSSICIDGIRLIKEGTVIGRTMTDYELLAERGQEDKYDEYRKTSRSSKVIGNYLRIIMRDKDQTVVENIEDYMKLDGDGDENQNTQNEHFSIIGTVLSRDEWVEKAVAYVNEKYPGATSSPFKSTEDMGVFYDICVEKMVNPEYAFATAAGESGFYSNNGNFWGLGTPNTSSSLATYGTWAVTLEAYCDTIISYQDPATWQYQRITEIYNERVACTDNGGIDPNGFGLPDTIQGIQSLYSNLGKHGDEYSGPGMGGYYYMDPAIAGVTKIYATHEEFMNKCRNKGGEHASGTDVTIWENGQYTAWQVEKKINVAKEAFGELAGTHNP